MKGLTQEQINNLKNLDNIKLLNLLEGYSDREYLIDLQNASGIAHKDISDPDVKALKDSVIAIREEIKKRIQGQSNIAILDNDLLLSKQIAHNSACRARALGIPDISKSESEIKQIKANYNTIRTNLEVIIKK